MKPGQQPARRADAGRPGSLALGVFLLAVLSATPAPLQAAAGDRSLGVQLGGTSRPAGRLGGHLSLGLAELLALRLEAELGLGPDRPDAPHGLEAVTGLGLTLAYDVLAWVPALTVLAGAALGPGPVQARALARAEVRRYLGLHMYAWLGAGAEWRRHSCWGIGQLGLSWEL